jgi:hypothetical protein
MPQRQATSRGPRRRKLTRRVGYSDPRGPRIALAVAHRARSVDPGVDPKARVGRPATLVDDKNTRVAAPFSPFTDGPRRNRTYNLEFRVIFEARCAPVRKPGYRNGLPTRRPNPFPDSLVDKQHCRLALLQIVQGGRVLPTTRDARFHGEGTTLSSRRRGFRVPSCTSARRRDLPGGASSA